MMTVGVVVAKKHFVAATDVRTEAKLLDLDIAATSNFDDNHTRTMSPQNP